MQYPCPKPFLYNCACPPYPDILHTPTLTHYPASGLLVVKGRLYLIARPCLRGPHFLLALLKAIESDRYELLATVLFYQYCFERVFASVCMNPNGSMELFKLRVHISLGGIPVIHHVKRIQRWARTLVPARAGARRLALAMALHARLGAASPLGSLGADALGLVLRA